VDIEFLPAEPEPEGEPYDDYDDPCPECGGPMKCFPRYDSFCPVCDVDDYEYDYLS
jgi:hypothetical protein